MLSVYLSLHRQAASLFYDTILSFNYNTDVPSLFQNYSNCFLGPSVPSTQARFRSIDGSGNNLKNKLMGASFTSFGRFLNSQYGDNIYSIRKSITGDILPSPRTVVQKLFLNNKVHLNSFLTHEKVPNTLAIFFGQYIAHDVAARQFAQYFNSSDDESKFTRFPINFNLQAFSPLRNSVLCPLGPASTSVIFKSLGMPSD